MQNYADVNIIKSCILGHAVGDALGVPVEFSSREELDENPVSGMKGFGTYPFPAGCWSDDTSMTLCALDSLAKGKIDLDDVMRNFGKWYYNNGFTPTGETFDVGTTCSYAIENYFENKMDSDHCGMAGERNNGNGSLMRIIPFVLYMCSEQNQKTVPNSMPFIFSASALTHAHEVSRIGCGIYAVLMYMLICNRTIKVMPTALHRAWVIFCDYPEISRYSRLFESGFAELTREEIRSSGYVVDTLEAAVWCLYNSESYRECVLKAVNLGDDTDTVAAVAGGLAGALYGYDAIPEEWLAALKRREYIEGLCERAAEAWKNEETCR